jgi:hypothetical protein
MLTVADDDADINASSTAFRPVHAVLVARHARVVGSIMNRNDLYISKVGEDRLRYGAPG